jgi:hypothetical protein
MILLQIRYRALQGSDAFPRSRQHDVTVAAEKATNAARAVAVVNVRETATTFGPTWRRDLNTADRARIQLVSEQFPKPLFPKAVQTKNRLKIVL